MSWVTDVLLLTGLQEGFDENFETLEEIPAIKAINVWLEQNEFGTLDELHEHVLGGGKAMQALVYGGAFNFLRIEEFIRLVRAQPWQEPDNVQLLLKNEDEGRFRLYDFPGGEQQT
jgi:hypothetical protein